MARRVPDVVPRACVLLRSDLCAVANPEFCKRDLAAARIEIKVIGGGKISFIVASAYWPYDSSDSLPPDDTRDLVRYARESGLGLVLGCDANAHHVAWGSTDTKRRAEAVLEFIPGAQLRLLNVGGEHNFCNKLRKEVIGLTLCTNELQAKIGDWRVTSDVTLSDHRLISCYLEVAKVCAPPMRNPRRMDWEANYDPSHLR